MMTEAELIEALTKLMYDRARLVLSDAEDLAFDVLNLVKDKGGLR